MKVVMASPAHSSEFRPNIVKALMAAPHESILTFFSKTLRARTIYHLKSPVDGEKFFLNLTAIFKN